MSRSKAYPVADNTVISLQLKAADANPDIDSKIPSGWADFRGTAYDANGNMTGTANTNNGVTKAKIPFAAESGTLYWASKVGDGYSEEAVGNPILVGGNLIAYAGTRILKIDKDTGTVLREGTMAGTSSFAINNSTCAEGMILVGLSNGRDSGIQRGYVGISLALHRSARADSQTARSPYQTVTPIQASGTAR